MQTVTSRFNELLTSPIVPVNYKFKASFDKAYDPTATVFTLDVSLLDGPDILAVNVDNVITEWDKYEYDDFTNRVQSIEWVKELDQFYSITSSIADITLNNYDSLFTRNTTSLLSDYLIPRRPIRITSGIGTESLPQFVGLTETVPEVNSQSRTADLHGLDFLSYIFSKKLDQSGMYIDKRVDEIITSLFGLVGVLPSQMILDTALTSVPFAFFEKDTTIGYAVRELMRAEMGLLYMDEAGYIVFKNRYKQNTASIYTFNNSNIVSYESSREEKIINSVTVKSEIREVQPRQIVFNMSEVVEVKAGATVNKFFQFDDPVTTVEPITAYTANSSQDGTGTDVYSDVEIVTETLFSDTMLVGFKNNGTSTLYITNMTIDGTPAKIVRKVNIVQKNQDSIDAFGEESYLVESKYIQDSETAESIAQTLLTYYKDYGGTIILDVKPNVALQLGDRITVDVDNINDEFIITKIHTVIDRGRILRYTQKITAQKYNIPNYFIISSDSEAQSLLDGEDVLA